MERKMVRSPIMSHWMCDTKIGIELTMKFKLPRGLSAGTHNRQKGYWGIQRKVEFVADEPN